MKKRKLLFNGLLGVFAFITMIISLITLNTSVSNFGVADYTPYAITLDKNNNKVETRSLSSNPSGYSGYSYLKTDLGNDVKIYYYGFGNYEDGWQTIRGEGYLELEDYVHGISKLEINRTTKGRVIIYYSYSDDGTDRQSLTIKDTDDPFISVTFNDYYPNTFTIVFYNETPIIDAKIEYTCTEHYFNANVTSNDETKGTVTGSGFYKIGSSVTLTATATADNIFSGWYSVGTNNLQTADNPYTFIMPEADVNLYAKFVPIQKGTTISFGTYPTHLMTDAALKSELNALAGPLPTETDPQAWTSYRYYEVGSPSDYMWYIDVTYNLEKYRGVYFTEYRPYYPHYQTEDKYSQQDDNGFFVNQVRWFKWHPITWTILDVVNDKEVFVLSNLCLDSQQFYYSPDIRTLDGVTIYPNNYMYSDIRTWLNDTFYNAAFTAEEQAKIMTTNVDNSAETTRAVPNDYACENTFDKVFLLSNSEATNTDYGLNTLSSRVKSGTPYAYAQGLNYKSVLWGLRSPEVFDGTFYKALRVGSNGVISKEDTRYSSIGIAPAMWISLSSPEVGDTIEYGSYPQSKVTDTALTDELNALTGTLPTETDPGTWTDYEYYIESNVTSYMFYKDVTLGNDMYRGVYFIKYRPINTSLISDIDNSYQDDNGYTLNTVYWFKFEPIVWNIHKVSNGKLFLSTDKILDSQHFYNNQSSRTIDGALIRMNNYEHSDIRIWLSSKFYQSAFNPFEQYKVLLTNVDNSLASTTYSSCSWLSDDTTDKVFLLSRQEVNDTTLNFTDAIITKSGSDYAYAQGLFRSDKGESTWQLRTPDNGAIVYNATIYLQNRLTYSREVFVTTNGIVPAMWVTL